MKMKTKLFRKIVETHGRASLRLQTVETWRATSLLLLLLATAPAFAQDAPQEDADLLYVCAGKGYKLFPDPERGATGSALTYTWHVNYSGNNNGFQALDNSNAAARCISASAGRTPPAKKGRGAKYKAR